MVNDKQCCGHDVYPSTHISCGRPLADFNIVSGRALRCPHCVTKQLIFNRDRHEAKLRASRKSVPRTGHNFADPYTPIKRCKVCTDLPHRRPPSGCKECGRPFLEEVIRPQPGLRSPMRYTQLDISMPYRAPQTSSMITLVSNR